MFENGNLGDLLVHHVLAEQSDIAASLAQMYKNKNKQKKKCFEKKNIQFFLSFNVKLPSSSVKTAATVATTLISPPSAGLPVTSCLSSWSWCEALYGHVRLPLAKTFQTMTASSFRHGCSGGRRADPEGDRSVLHQRQDQADPQLQ